MENRDWSLLLLVTAAAAVTTSPSQHRTQSYEEAVALAVDFYNQGSGIDHAFRLLKADPQPGWDMTSNPRQKLKFTIKETACLVSENLRGTECGFRDNGVVRDCSGLFSTEPESPVIIIISCDAVSEEVGQRPLALYPLGHRMETCLKVLLIVGLVTATPAPSSIALPTHEEAIVAAVRVYNEQPGTTLAYRLLEAEPQPDWDSSSKTIQPLTFTVKESVCPITEKRDFSQCEYKEDGLVKDCSGFFSTEQDPPAAIIKCEETSEEPTVVTRGRWGRWRRKIGGFVRRNRWQIVATGLKLIG
ncbi:uncharacterized protein [Emydura macquarii macquarii]|uniref:uncharacterized protein n=1 Tax=Emydura macquarii macquarii TaxID=1129001 RepID=UPI00352B3FEE